MDRFDYMTDNDIKAELKDLTDERKRRDLPEAAREAAIEAIDKGLDELLKRDGR
ncbi:hypothetical protein [Streptomyces uncialis]|uniref:hypothetical protein n=1 Tax=Streptomyces uncialis TaxID=1048205 RepID=UPI000AD3F8EE|nr:hypothetical protein [Streptomyces uncialis]